MNREDTRWQQRFENFEKTLLLLQNAMNISNPDIFQKAGMIQFFEISFELSWNVLKDYMEAKGFVGMRSPRDAIKKAFEIGMITDGHTWIQTLENRNLTAHTYDEAMAEKVIQEIVVVHYPLLFDLYNQLKLEI